MGSRTTRARPPAWSRPAWHLARVPAAGARGTRSVALALGLLLAGALPDGCAAGPGAAAASRHVHVRLFSMRGCEGCDIVRRWLRERDIRFTELEVTTDPAAAAELRRLDARGRTPTIDVDGLVVPEPRFAAIEDTILRAAERAERRDRPPPRR